MCGHVYAVVGNPSVIPHIAFYQPDFAACSELRNRAHIVQEFDNVILIRHVVLLSLIPGVRDLHDHGSTFSGKPLYSLYSSM
jgi:hypothetical protein